MPEGETVCKNLFVSMAVGLVYPAYSQSSETGSSRSQRISVMTFDGKKWIFAGKQGFTKPGMLSRIESFAVDHIRNTACSFPGLLWPGSPTDLEV